MSDFLEFIYSSEPDGGDGLIGIVVRRGYDGEEGIKFFTAPENPQQVAYINRGEGYVVPPHVHIDRDRVVRKTQEVLFVRRGAVRVRFFTSSGGWVDDRVLTDGDVCILLGGGHSLEFLEGTSMFEVKQGPYLGKEQDKKGI